MLNHRNLMVITGISGALCVSLGAMGAHALKPILPPEQMITFETGIKYHFYHTLALLVIAYMIKTHPSRSLALSGIFFVSGILLFSFSLYFLAFRPFFGINYDELKWVGAITPFGGISFILAWLMLIFAARPS